MGARGRPSLKISSEERLERRRAQLAESQRKCRARKRAGKASTQGSQGSMASASPSQEALSPASAETLAEDTDMEEGWVEGFSLSLHPHTGTDRESVAVPGVAPASDSDLNNQVPKAHFADMKPEQAVLCGDSTEFQPWSSDLDDLLEENWEGLIDTGLVRFEYDYIQPSMTSGTPEEYLDQSPDAFGQSSYGLSQTDDSPSLSPLTLPFPQDAIPFSQHHNAGSTPADFVLFDLDRDLLNMNTPGDNQENFDSFLYGSPTYQSKPDESSSAKKKCRDVLFPPSDFDATMSEIVASYWQPGNIFIAAEDSTIADT